MKKCLLTKLESMWLYMFPRLLSSNLRLKAGGKSVISSILLRFSEGKLEFFDAEFLLLVILHFFQVNFL